MRVYSHRGMHQKAPENTLAAYKLAIERDCDIELDVRITTDGHLICFHDSTLGRTAPSEGMPWSYTLAELKALDAGSWFSPEYKDERIPTLEEAFNLTKGKAHIAIEMKAVGIEKPLLKLLEEKQMFEEIFLFDSFSSADFLFGSRLKVVYPEVRVGRNCISEHDFQTLMEIKFEDVDVIMAMTPQPWLKKELVKAAHDYGVTVIDTSVTKKEKLENCLEMEIDGIVSDCPDEMKKILLAI